MSDALEHIRYIIDLVGIDYVGIGSDFDGGGELIGCRAANELIQITVKLLGLGYTVREIEKIWGGQPVARNEQSTGVRSNRSPFN